MAAVRVARVAARAANTGAERAGCPQVDDPDCACEQPRGEGGGERGVRGAGDCRNSATLVASKPVPLPRLLVRDATLHSVYKPKFCNKRDATAPLVQTL